VLIKRGIVVSDANTNFFADFFDDYFAESEEHLVIVRQSLLALEPCINQEHIDSTHLNQLFRSFHSIKGLSGMVGVKDAEELAHQMESYLKVLREGQVGLTPAGFDALLDGTKLLEQVIVQARDHKSVTNITPIKESLQALLPATLAPPPPETTLTQAASTHPLGGVSLKLKDGEQEHLEEALTKGFKLWQLEFVPSNELVKRGVNVNYIRDRLQTIGQLIHSAPRMSSQGGIVFDFLLGTPKNIEPPFNRWEKDGLTWMPYSISELLAPPPTPPEEVSAPIPVSVPASPEPSPTVTVLPDTQESRPQSTTPIPTTEAPTTPTASPLVTQSANVVRVDLPKLDELMRMVGDLVITRARLEDLLVRIKENLPPAQLRSLQEINLTLERQLRDLREGVMGVRLVPIGDVFARMQFVVRDLVRETKKQVQLDSEGQETEIDKFVVERMMDPLLHLVRNAISHGIEPEADRVKKGKSPQGKIKLKASTSGEMVVIEIHDDGRGIDRSKVIEKARALGLLPDETINKNNLYDSNTLLDILCAPGFSTCEVADLTSGRGVGMSIVKNTIQELGGFLCIETEPDRGTHFIIQLPLTLAIADALIINVCEQTFAIPQAAVREVIEVVPTAITFLENNEIIAYRSDVFPLIRLGDIFGLSPHPRSNTNSQNTEKNTLEPPVKEPSETSAIGLGRARNAIGHSRARRAIASLLRVIIVGSGLKRVALAVDRIIGLREIVVRSLVDPFLQVPGISGVTELGDGRIILILDVNALERIWTQLKRDA
jgi:two-component system, chemotaxis family, sensor kinase CheA